MSIHDYFRKKKASKLRKRYTARTGESIALGFTSGNPVFLWRCHPVTEQHVIEHVKSQPTYREPLPPDFPLWEDMYFTTGLNQDGDRVEYGVCDIHNLAFVALMVGRGIRICDEDEKGAKP